MSKENKQGPSHIHITVHTWANQLQSPAVKANKHGKGTACAEAKRKTKLNKWVERNPIFNAQPTMTVISGWTK